MKRLPIIAVVSLLILLPLTSGRARAQISTTPPATLLFSEVKIKNTSATETDEFIEIYNNGDTAVQLENYFLEYFNVADPITTTASTHKGPFALPALSFEPNNLLVLAVNPAKVPGSVQLAQITSLKDSEGHLRLLSYDGVAYKTEDSLSWKAATVLPAGVIEAPTNGAHSLQRFTESDDVPVVFNSEWKADSATPGALLVVVPPVEEPDPEPVPPPVEPSQEPEPILDTDPEPLPSIPEVTLLPVVITELLPNPMAPQTDTFDEYVEIYNPNTEPIDLTGYEVQTGSKYSYKHELTGVTIPAGGYIIFTSGDTSLALANSGSQARLVDGLGVVVSEASAYTDAPEGQAWAFSGGAWQWTTTPTLAGLNVITSPVAKVPSPKATSKAKPATTKKTTAGAAKPKAAKTKAATKKKEKVPVERQVYEDPAIVTVAPIHPWVIAGVSSLALLYAGYEYRFDMQNRLYQFRRYREARRAARPQS